MIFCMREVTERYVRPERTSPSYTSAFCSGRQPRTLDGTLPGHPTSIVHALKPNMQALRSSSRSGGGVWWSQEKPKLKNLGFIRKAVERRPRWLATFRRDPHITSM